MEHLDRDPWYLQDISLLFADVNADSKSICNLGCALLWLSCLIYKMGTTELKILVLLRVFCEAN